MRKRRGRFQKSLEETVSVNGERPGTDYSKDDQKITILEDRTPRLTPEGVVVQDLRYIGNISPPNNSIWINDKITRTGRAEPSLRGSSNEDIQILTVESIEIIDHCQIQQLKLTDRDRPIR